MTCPYLTEVRMVFCQASPVKKLIPTDRVSTASACEAESYEKCPLFQEALARAKSSASEMEKEEREEKDSPPAGEKGARQ